MYTQPVRHAIVMLPAATMAQGCNSGYADGVSCEDTDGCANSPCFDGVECANATALTRQLQQMASPAASAHLGPQAMV